MPTHAPSPDAAVPLLSVAGLSKHFPGVKALTDVSFDLRPGEVHCLIGENGAGKSTFVKIIAGAQRPDAGTIHVRGDSVTLNGPRDAKALGLAFIFQELSVVDGLTVAENIVLGDEPGRGVRFDRRAAEAIAADLLAGIGFGQLDPATRVGRLSTAEKQAVMIAKALCANADIIVMDEPTSPLEEQEVRRLFEIIARLKAAGKGIVYVSHKMREIDEIGDRVTIFKDGRKVATLARGEAEPRELVRLMVGRDLGDIFPAKGRRPGRVVLAAEKLSGARIRDVSLTVRAGEIVGIAGLVGAGRTELMRSIFGADTVVSGSVTVDGAPLGANSIRGAIRSGLGLVPEERRAQGIVGVLSVFDNLLLPWNEFPASRRETGAPQAVAQRTAETMDVRTPSLAQRISLLSGGNQQKVVVGKWLTMNTKVLLLDEPTRGVDIGAKREIYRIIDELARQGLAILLVSSELPEVIGLADRIIVLNQGRVVGELPGTASESEVMELSMLHEPAA
ncbi:sugar ABC transporter ATP-binding protein [Kaistia algarum]|uniref:sugar ABC transporter ATP-binding protein n=1 Tax=Kaistia algarum TaxID=2083279 RepID=UPI000CE86B72|nr:sugar ABC transporter ATP-binding protein [Kaistia algarum]MCX5516293.1 sugar ABC transporter ATP-binding protein [Kaistia algarum]PPE78786.1 sugar ABC transporter ATP-binding protein [Kaistia algarum]